MTEELVQLLIIEKSTEMDFLEMKTAREKLLDFLEMKTAMEKLM